MDSNYLGAQAESQFISYALENGWEVAHPFLKAVSYDSLIRRDPKESWETVQIKHAYYYTRAGRKFLEASCRRSSTGTKYKDGDFDWLFVFHKEGKWFLPWDLIRGKRSSIRVGCKTYDLWKV